MKSCIFSLLELAKAQSDTRRSLETWLKTGGESRKSRIMESNDLGIGKMTYPAFAEGGVSNEKWN